MRRQSYIKRELPAIEYALLNIDSVVHCRRIGYCLLRYPSRTRYQQQQQCFIELVNVAVLHQKDSFRESPCGAVYLPCFPYAQLRTTVFNVNMFSQPTNASP